MSITINIYYTGINGNARKFASEMESSRLTKKICEEDGNLRYEYFYPANDDETVLLIDSWKNQESIDFHHVSPMMLEIAKLRDKYDLHMRVERYVSDDTNENVDHEFIRK